MSGDLLEDSIRHLAKFAVGPRWLFAI
jgi:hypothetical protein